MDAPPNSIPPDLFVREDVSKPENRVNLAFFALTGVAPFRERLLQRLDLPTDSVLYPPQNIAGGRPDFVVVSPAGEVLLWIEVELGPPDQRQLANYRATLQEPVVCLGGSSDCDLAHVFVQLVTDLAGRRATFTYIEPGETLRRDNFLSALRHRLPGVVHFGTPPAHPGRALVTTGTQKGWSIRVYSPIVSPERSVSILWNQAFGRGEARVPSAKRLVRCLRESTGVERYASFLRDTCHVDITALDEARSMPIRVSVLQQRIDEFADQVRALATLS